MINKLLFLAFLATVSPSGAGQPAAPAVPGSSAHVADAPARVGFAIIKTAGLQVREGLTYSGGSLSKMVESAFSAFLVKHGEEYFLFDTGLGSKVAEQYDADMPLWYRPLFRYEQPVTPVREQLDKAGIGPIRRIFLSHAHWDHAGGVVDFPDAVVAVAKEEMEEIRGAQRSPGRAWPSQVASAGIRWQELTFSSRPYEGFDRSLDLFNDGSIVFVPMYGHTTGSIGMFLTADSGKRYFFVGDVIWSAGAISEARPKFWLARSIVDRDAGKTQRTIELIRDVAARNPGLVVVPAHDGPLHNTLGYFPRWVK
ncbi:MAG TPA: MBL fold metallo-hydrolase [Noviherbaspirillum sp.]|jgi:glyoxylase-like metal-dependent hydrolase (beta-lactamase superfamily II)|uniref:MBL fold metallo-hydrolase n=1 Tax=Noviherbaspirillum sp. TaxID=1926288 RepID=UPI002F9412CA